MCIFRDFLKNMSKNTYLYVSFMLWNKIVPNIVNKMPGQNQANFWHLTIFHVILKRNGLYILVVNPQSGSDTMQDFQFGNFLSLLNTRGVYNLIWFPKSIRNPGFLVHFFKFIIVPKWKSNWEIICQTKDPLSG